MMSLSNEENSENFKDGQTVTYAGIISSIKKKYTKRNTLMAFATIEDLYGYCEVIVFDSVYQRAVDILLEDNIVKVEGRLSLREEEFPKIVANNIKEFTEQNSNVVADIIRTSSEQKRKTLKIDITNINEEKKNELRGFIRFFNGEKNNIALIIEEDGQEKPAGAIYVSTEMLEELKKLIGEERVIIKEV